jgi:chemotaxis response regulator CheB
MRDILWRGGQAMTAIRVVLVDDQQLFRKGVRALLEEEGEFEIVGEKRMTVKERVFVCPVSIE